MMNYDLLGSGSGEALQTCSLTWEMGCNFLNHFRGGKKRKKVVRNRRVNGGGQKPFEAFLKDGEKKRKSQGAREERGRVTKRAAS